LTTTLGGCTAPPAQTYDVALLDLDGVVYLGADAVPHAIDALTEATTAGMRLAYVTNNASRTPQQVADRLTSLGARATAEDVVTSAQAAATLLAARLSPGDAVLVTGAAALHEAVAAVGLRPVSSADDDPRAVVMGYDPTLDYARLSEAAVAVRRGALFVASNLDATLPSSRGPLPGMGSLAALVITATGQHPVVAGKPERPLMDESITRTDARRPLVVGDRLDTDIEGAQRTGVPSMLVMTGVTDLLTVATAPPQWRPSLIASDLRGLSRPHPPAGSGKCGEAVAEYEAGANRVVVRTRGDDARDETLAAIVTAAWQAIDSGHVVETVDAP
jgi:HAD superfamily hydrolase (TIGR01450 family)